MSQITPFDWLNSINLKTDVDDPECKTYNSFIVNRGLSYFRDTVLWANEMNQRQTLDNDIKHSFLKTTINKKKRFSKWFKAEKNDDIEVVIESYKVSRQRAIELLSLLDKEKLNSLREKLFKGGKG